MTLPQSALKLLGEVLSLPTAPFAERHVIAYVEAFCASRGGATLRKDSAGNLLVHVKKGKARVSRPVCLTAHLDHPGFIADKMLAQGRLGALWRGGVKPPYFVGSAVRFHVDGRRLKGRIRSITTAGKGAAASVKKVVVDISGEVPRGAIGMWDLPDPVVRANRIYAGPCDDLTGVAAMLCCIDRVARSAAGAEGYFLFTRAEEVGFVGALAACRLKTIPGRCFVVAVENSSELPGARMGAGPILRVGDRATIFSPAVTAHCRTVADRLAASKRFRYQRKLMDGGMCESTAYCELGYEATGVCLALGNYHNMNVKRKRISPEYVDLDDFNNLVKWFVELCKPQNRYTGRNPALRARFNKLNRRYGSLLRRTVRGTGV